MNPAAARRRQEPVAVSPSLRVYEEFRSRFSPRPRAVSVLLPPGYESEPRRRYPVLYLQDGQNVFDARDRTAFGKGTWRLDKTARDLMLARLVRPFLVVAVDNTPDRMAEYTPARDAKHGGGRADDYAALLAEDLRPFIDARYRTRQEPRAHAVAGSSLGALAALHTALKYPDLFGGVGVLSPSVWWADKAVLKQIDAVPALGRTRPRVYLSTGTEEGFSTLPQCRELRDRMLARGWASGSDLLYEEAAGDKHDEPAWARRVPSLLRFLFPA